MTKRLRNRHSVRIFAIVLAALATLSVEARTPQHAHADPACTWTSGDPGTPTSVDDVCVTAGNTLAISSDTTYQSLTVDADGDVDIESSGSGDCPGVTLTLTRGGTLAALSTMQLITADSCTNGGDVTLTSAPGATLVNSGQITSMGEGTLSGAVSNQGGTLDSRRRLSVSDLSNYDASTQTLSGGGTYAAYPGGELDLPGDVATLAAGVVDAYGGSIPQLSALSAISGGILNVQSGGTLTTSGPLTLSGGSIRLGKLGQSSDPSSLSVGGGHSPLTVAGGTALMYDSAVHINADTVDLTAGRIEGMGTLSGNLDATGGTLEPADGELAPGLLTIDGDLTAGSSATLADFIGQTSSGAASEIDVNGAASLGGTLELYALNGLTTGRHYSLINATGGLTGSFSPVENETSYDETFDYAATSAAVVAGRYHDTLAPHEHKSTVTYGHEHSEVFGTYPYVDSVPQTGTVTVTSGSTRLCSYRWNGGPTNDCRPTPHALGVGMHTITIAYAGDANNYPARATQSLTVTKEASSTSLRLDRSSVPKDEESTVRFTIAVTPQYPGHAPGQVVVNSGHRLLCTASLKDGKASCRSSHRVLGAGSHQVEAVYAGTADIDGSTSARQTLHVTKPR